MDREAFGCLARLIQLDPHRRLEIGGEVAAGIPPDQLAHVHAPRSADNDQVIYQLAPSQVFSARKGCTDIRKTLSSAPPRAGQPAQPYRVHRETVTYPSLSA